MAFDPSKKQNTRYQRPDARHNEGQPPVKRKKWWMNKWILGITAAFIGSTIWTSWGTIEKNRAEANFQEKQQAKRDATALSDKKHLGRIDSILADYRDNGRPSLFQIHRAEHKSPCVEKAVDNLHNFGNSGFTGNCHGSIHGDKAPDIDLTVNYGNYVFETEETSRLGTTWKEKYTVTPITANGLRARATNSVDPKTNPLNAAMLKYGAGALLNNGRCSAVFTELSGKIDTRVNGIDTTTYGSQMAAAFNVACQRANGSRFILQPGAGPADTAGPATVDAAPPVVRKAPVTVDNAMDRLAAQKPQSVQVHCRRTAKNQVGFGRC